MINQYKSQAPGGYWPNGLTVNGKEALPIPSPGAPWQDKPVISGKACVESQRDGIPDEWKKQQHLNTNKRDLHKSLAPDGYTILEHYLNGTPVTK